MTEPRGERGRQGAAPLGGMTPGPWEIEWDQVEDERPWPAWLNAPGDHTLLSFAQATDADARLIAAAPELLEALEDCFYNRPGWQDKARSALTKARGEQ